MVLLTTMTVSEYHRPMKEVTMPRSPTFALLSIISLPLAAVELPAVFSDHAVLQAGVDTPVWGRGRDGEQITVTMGGVTAKATVAHGTWMVHLKGLVPTEVGQVLIVKGDNILTVHDVVVGDVWLCSGQSNMEWTVQKSHNGQDEIPKATDTGIRVYIVPKTTSRTPLNDVKAAWQVLSPESVAGFSAVGYYFGREVRAARKRPVGLLGSYWGATQAQSWTSTEGLAVAPAFGNYLEAQAEFDRNLEKLRAEWPETKAKYDAAVKKVKDTNVKAQTEWDQMVANAKATGQPMPKKPKILPEPKRVYSPDLNPGIPANLFNGMIAPLIPYGITGAIWYQGESNSGAADEYATLFPRMITDWRGRWGRGDFPFLFVHLSTWQEAQQAPVEHGGIPQVRLTQQAALALPNTGMASALDINAGSDIHPADKLDVGKRLAQVARKVAYGDNVACEGPRFKSMTVEGSALRVTFDHADGLHVAVPPWLGPKATVPSATEPASFAVCGIDGVWQWAKARIDGSAIVLTSDNVTAPVAAAFAWAPNPQVNVYNAQGLPMLPFVSDAAKLPAAGK